MAFLGSSRAAGRFMVLLQMALFVIVSALIMNSSVCLGAAGHDNIAGSGSLDGDSFGCPKCSPPAHGEPGCCGGVPGGQP